VSSFPSPLKEKKGRGQLGKGKSSSISRFSMLKGILGKRRGKKGKELAVSHHSILSSRREGWKKKELTYNILAK